MEQLLANIHINDTSPRANHISSVIYPPTAGELRIFPTCYETVFCIIFIENILFLCQWKNLAAFSLHFCGKQRGSLCHSLHYIYEPVSCEMKPLVKTFIHMFWWLNTSNISHMFCNMAF